MKTNFPCLGGELWYGSLGKIAQGPGVRELLRHHVVHTHSPEDQGSSGSSTALVATPLVLRSYFLPNPSGLRLAVPWGQAFLYLISGGRCFSAPPPHPATTHPVFLRPLTRGFQNITYLHNGGPNVCSRAASSLLPEIDFSSVQFSHSVVFDSLRPHESQHARPPCLSPTPGVHSGSRPSSH